MEYRNYFKDLLESVPDYRKKVLLMFLIKNDVDLINACGFLRNDINRLNIQFKNLLMEQNEEDLNYNKNGEE